MKALIDTNVIINALMSREPWATTSQKLLRLIAMEKLNGYIAVSQTTDIFYLLCRQGVDKAAAKNIIKKLINSVKVVDITPTDVQNALASDINDYEDALLAYCGKRHKAGCIITRNKKDFEKSPILVLAPDEFIEKYFPHSFPS